MFFILSKILLFFTSPLFWWCVALLFAFYGTSPTIRRRFRLVVIISFLFFTNTFIFLEFERLWEIPGTPIEDIHKTYDAGIVLSGMATYDNDLNRLSIQEGTDRIWHTITLYKKGIIRKIIITGRDGTIIDNGLNEAVQFKHDLVIWGIPEVDILIEDVSRNTYENALYTKELLGKHPEIKSLLLITSSNHMRRAAACLSKQELKFDTFSTNLFNGKNRFWTFDHLMIPSFSTFVKWNNLTKEWTGYVMYKVTGKI